MDQPGRILEEGTKVVVHSELQRTHDMFIDGTERRAGAKGSIVCAHRGMYGGDVYSVRHEDGTVGSYVFTEFEFAPSSLYRDLTRQLTRRRKDRYVPEAPTEDEILERMDVAWGKMTSEEKDEAERWNAEQAAKE